MTETDTCREFVTPRLLEAGWGAAESVIDRLQEEMGVLTAKHAAIRQANAVLMPATLERIFSTEAPAHA